MECHDSGWAEGCCRTPGARAEGCQEGKPCTCSEQCNQCFSWSLCYLVSCEDRGECLSTIYHLYIYTHNSLCIAAATYSWLCQDGISVDWAALNNWSVFPTWCVFYKWVDPSLLLDTVWPPIVRACNRSRRIPSIRCSQSVYLTNSQVIEQKLTRSTGVVKNYIQKTLKLKKQTSVLLLQKFCKWQLHT